jgi:hypothetical protein
MNLNRLEQVAAGARIHKGNLVTLDLETVENLITAVYALKGMAALHEDMMEKVNHRESFYDAGILEKMNSEPIRAKKILATLLEGL